MKTTLSIRNRLALSAIALVLIVVVVISGAAYQEVRRTAIAATNERLEAVSRQLADIFGASTRQAREQARVLSRDSAVRQYLSRRTDPTARSALAALSTAGAQPSSVAATELWDAGGQRLLTTRDTLAALSPNDAAALIGLLAAEQAALGWIIAPQGRLEYDVIARVNADTGPLGFVVQRRRLGASPQASIQLRGLIGPGVTLLLGNMRGDLWTDFVKFAPAPKVLGLRGAVEYERPAGRRVLASITPVPNTPWLIAVESPRALALGPVNAMLWRLGLVTLVLVLIAATGAWMVSGSLTRPIGQLVTAAERMSAGDQAHRVDVARWDEIGILGVAFNAMAERITQTHGKLEHKVQELEATEARYRMLFDASPQPMWVYDLETWRFLAVNDAAIVRYGYSREEFLSMTILDIRPADDRPALRANLSELDRHGGVSSDVWRHRAKDGTLIEVEVSSRELTFAGQRARLVLVNDLTDRRRAEESLRATQQRLERVIGSSGAVLYELRLEPTGTTLEWISSNVTQILGYDPSEAQASRWWSDNVHPDDRVPLGNRPEPSAYRDGANEYRFRHKDGRYRWLREEQRLIPGGPGEATEVVGAWIDITQQRQLEANFRQAQKMEAVGRLAGGVAHDFNNLLTIILAESQLVLTDSRMSAAQQRESLDQISKAAERAALLTRQLLTFSRRQLIEPTALDLNVVVAELNRMLHRLIGEDVDLRLSLSDSPVVATADRGQLEQVIVNLVVNARDAMPEGGVLTIETAITQLDEAYAETRAEVTPGPYVVLSVSDSGVGMTDDVKAHVFEPFFTTKESGKGTGLGLATSYGIAKQFGGHIAVYSEAGFGTTVKVFLPSSQAAGVGSTRTTSVVEGGTETILLVEDDQQVRRVAARILSGLGYTVLEAQSGAEALVVFAEHQDKVQLLVTDVVLPGMGGRALAEQVHELRPGLPVLFVSGYSDDVILQHRLVAHDVVLLQKPFSSEALASKIREAIRHRRPA